MLQVSFLLWSFRTYMYERTFWQETIQFRFPPRNHKKTANYNLGIFFKNMEFEHKQIKIANTLLDCCTSIIMSCSYTAKMRVVAHLRFLQNADQFKPSQVHIPWGYRKFSLGSECNPLVVPACEGQDGTRPAGASRGPASVWAWRDSRYTIHPLPATQYGVSPVLMACSRIGLEIWVLYVSGKLENRMNWLLTTVTSILYI